MAIRVVVVDDHPVIRDIVRIACNGVPGIEVVGEAEDGESGLELCRALRPDVLVLDLVLPGIDGFEVARALAMEGDGPKVLVISGRTDDEAVFQARRLGLAGFVPKTLFVQNVAEAIEAVARGETVYTDEQERVAIEGLGRMVRRLRETSRLTASLTDRELEVLRLLAQSFSNRQVARRLGISPKTVESHISSLYRKLGAKTRVEAVARALAHGLVEHEQLDERVVGNET
jgi:DNA-binding NarL/FixJ family response regulator